MRSFRDPAAIVIGLDSMTGLQTARVFAAHGVPVIGLAEDRQHFCCRTRVCEEIIEVAVQSDALLEALKGVARRLPERGLLVPCTDQAVLTISRNRETLADSFHFVLPDEDVVELLVDKIAFYRHAEQHALPIPRTFVLGDGEDVAAAAEALEYPALVKPPLRTPQWEAATKVKAYRVDSGRELLEVYEVARAWADVLLAQEWIDGTDADLYSCNCYFSTAGEPLATFVTRKLRQWPPRTGTGTLGVEWRDDVVLEGTLRLFESVGFRGLGYLEFKKDRRTGQHLIIEPNIGRPTGRSAIAEAGGVEMLMTMYSDVLGRPLPEQREQRYVGTKWIDHRRDFQAALYAWRHGDLGIRQWARSWSHPHASAVLSVRDPLPFGAELWQAGGKLAGLAAPRSRRSGRSRHELTHSRLTSPAVSRRSLRLEPFPLDESGAGEWDELALRSANIFATREWLTSWWRHFGGGRELVLTAARDASGRLVALLPVYVAVEGPIRVGRFLGHGPGDELGPICASHDRAATADALHDLLRYARIDVMLAEQVPAAWGDLLDGRVLRREGSPILKLGGRNWAEVLTGFSANLRQQVRRFERRLERDHRLVYQLSRDQLEQDLDDLFRLHALRWSQDESGFATLQQAFQREFAAVAAARGWLRLWFLEVDGCRVASWYGFRFGDVESYYQAGRDPAWERKSVGFVILAHSLRAAADDGIDEYRFLRGGEHFKYRFADADPGLETVGVANGRLGAAALLGAAAVPRNLHAAALQRLG